MPPSVSGDGKQIGFVSFASNLTNNQDLNDVADVFIQLSGFHAKRAAWRRVLLVVGFAFAAILTHFFASGIWRPA